MLLNSRIHRVRRTHLEGTHGPISRVIGFEFIVFFVSAVQKGMSIASYVCTGTDVGMNDTGRRLSVGQGLILSRRLGWCGGCGRKLR